MSKQKYVGLFVLLVALLLALIPLQGIHAQASVSGPVAQKWYFAEGRVGSGFKTFFSVQNPNNTSCAVKITYYYAIDGSTANQTKTVNFTVAANTRYTANANADVPGPSTLSAIVSVDTGATPTCSGVVAERPMYFNSFHSVNSGTEVMGTTDAGLHQQFYFADVPTHSAGESFLSILNPGDVTANISVVYYAGGSQVGNVASATVQPRARGTVQPNADLNLPAHVSAVVTSDRNILVERPTYYINEYGVSGSADVTGVSALSGDWYFAEGNTASGKQENLSLANFGDVDTTATVTLKSLSGATKDFPVTVKAHDLLIWNVNSNNNFSGATSEVAASVHSDTATLAVQRQMFGTYSGSNGNQSWQAQGVTDAFGATSPHVSYSFAEGFTSIRFNEYLLLQNPTGVDETVNVTLSNMLGHSYTASVKVVKNSRNTLNITQIVTDHLVNSGDDARAYAVSMSVNSDSQFVAERTMEWSAFGTQGANSVVGYAG
jgi:hypothetical protein